MSNSTPQYNPSDNDSKSVLVAGVFSIALSIIFFGLRIASRWLHEHRFDTSDVLLTISLPLTLAINGIILWCLGDPTKLGRHNDISDPAVFKLTMQSILAVECLYGFAMAFMKMSFLVLYLRIFPGKLFRYAIYFTCFVTMAWALVTLFGSIFICQPYEALWTIELRKQGAFCFPTLNFYVAGWPPNIFTDIVILVLPQIHIWKLQVATHNRIALVATFLVGTFAIVANIIRFKTIWFIEDLDLTYTIAPLALWTGVELAAGTICASLVTIRPLLVRLFGKTGIWHSQVNGTTSRRTFMSGQHQLTNIKPESSPDRDTNTLLGSTKIPKHHEILVTSDTFIEREPRRGSPMSSYKATISQC